MSNNSIHIQTNDITNSDLIINTFLINYNKYFDGTGISFNPNIKHFFYYGMNKDDLKKIIKILDNCSVKVNYKAKFYN